MKVPRLFVHVRLSIEGADIAVLESFRNDVLRLAARHAQVYGVRVKRRAITADQGAKLMAAYEVRAAKTRHP